MFTYANMLSLKELPTITTFSLITQFDDLARKCGPDFSPRSAAQISGNPVENRFSTEPILRACPGFNTPPRRVKARRSRCFQPPAIIRLQHNDIGTDTYHE